MGSDKVVWPAACKKLQTAKIAMLLAMLSFTIDATNDALDRAFNKLVLLEPCTLRASRVSFHVAFEANSGPAHREAFHGDSDFKR